MKILVYSVKKHEIENEGWHRDGDEIKYYPNGIYKVQFTRMKAPSNLYILYHLNIHLNMIMTIYILLILFLIPTLI